MPFQSHGQRIKQTISKQRDFFPSDEILWFSKIIFETRQHSKYSQKNKQNLSENREACCFHAFLRSLSTRAPASKCPESEYFSSLLRDFSKSKLLSTVFVETLSQKEFFLLRISLTFIFKRFGICSETSCHNKLRLWCNFHHNFHKNRKKKEKKMITKIKSDTKKY